MKKLLIILMVVAMASFLFVGCMPGVTPPVDGDEDEDEEPVVPASTAPTIFDIQNAGATSIVNVAATGTEYINKTEAGTYILVVGIAKSKALVQVYIGSATTPTAVGEAATSGLFSIAVIKSTLGADGAKTIYTTATEAGLAESAKSNEVKFTLDTVAPKISKAVPDQSDLIVTVTFNEAVDKTTAQTIGNWTVDNITASTTGLETAPAVLKSSTVVEVTVTALATVGDVVSVYCDTIKDVAGNPIPVATPSQIYSKVVL